MAHLSPCGIGLADLISCRAKSRNWIARNAAERVEKVLTCSPSIVSSSSFIVSPCVRVALYALILVIGLIVSILKSK
jgi:hypothetical protein